MRTRSGSELTRQSNQAEAEILLREYDNLTQHIRTFVTGQYTFATIGVALVLGLLSAAINWGRYEMLIPLPTSFFFMACVIGLQLAMMHYLDRHLGVVEDRINRLGSAGQSPLLTWYTQYSFPHLGQDPRDLTKQRSPSLVRRFLATARSGDPMARWLGVTHLLVGLTFLGLLGAGGWAIFYVLPDDICKVVPAVTAAVYVLTHLGLAWFVFRTFAEAGDMAADTYKEMQERGAPERGVTSGDTAAKTELESLGDSAERTE